MHQLSGWRGRGERAGRSHDPPVEPNFQVSKSIKFRRQNGLTAIAEYLHTFPHVILLCFSAKMNAVISPYLVRYLESIKPVKWIW